MNVLEIGDENADRSFNDMLHNNVNDTSSAIMREFIN